MFISQIFVKFQVLVWISHIHTVLCLSTLFPWHLIGCRKIGTTSEFSMLMYCLRERDRESKSEWMWRHRHYWIAAAGKALAIVTVAEVEVAAWGRLRNVMLSAKLNCWHFFFTGKDIRDCNHISQSTNWNKWQLNMPSLFGLSQCTIQNAIPKSCNVLHSQFKNGTEAKRTRSK